MSCSGNSRKTEEHAAVERVLEVARMGRRRAEMIARNHKVEPEKRAEKEEIMQWFKVWLETPDAFFDWLEVRKVFAGFPEAVRQERVGGCLSARWPICITCWKSSRSIWARM